MKPEPLKDKKNYTQGEIYTNQKPRPLDLIEVEVFFPAHIRSAVEWLKEEIDRRLDVWVEVSKKADTLDRKEGVNTITLVLSEIKDMLINKAFEDVIKK